MCQFDRKSELNLLFVLNVGLANSEMAPYCLRAIYQSMAELKLKSHQSIGPEQPI